MIDMTGVPQKTKAAASLVKYSFVELRVLLVLVHNLNLPMYPITSLTETGHSALVVIDCSGWNCNHLTGYFKFCATFTGLLSRVSLPFCLVGWLFVCSILCFFFFFFFFVALCRWCNTRQ